MDLTNGCLFEAVLTAGLMSEVSSQESQKFLLEFIQKKLGHCEDNDEDVMKNRIKGFTSNLKTKWLDCKSRIDYFRKKNEKWRNLPFNTSIEETKKADTSDHNLSTQRRKRGRPVVLFQEASTKTRQRRMKKILDSRSQEEICCAAVSVLNQSGHRAAASVVKEVTSFDEYSPLHPVKMRRTLKKQNQRGIVPNTADEALALYVDCRLKKNSYKKIRKNAMTLGANIYPSYDPQILQAKKKCYPEDIAIFNYGKKNA